MGESPLDPSEQQKEITCNVKRDWIDKATILFEGIGLFTLIIYAVFTIKIWCANKHAADAAASAAATAAKQFESQERPWLSIRVSLAGSFILDEYYATLPTLVTLKNTGHTPAIRVLINPEFFPMPPSVAKERERLCEQTKLQLTANPNMGDVIFPDSNDFVKQENITINRDTLLKAVRENHDSVLPVAIYCVAYASTFDKTPHVSAAAFEVRHYDAKTNNTLAIFPEQTPILRPEELRLYYTQESPTYAD